jgi:uncharacterized membrane protein YgcG
METQAHSATPALVAHLNLLVREVLMWAAVPGADWLVIAHRVLHRLDAYCRTDDVSRLSTSQHAELVLATTRVSQLSQGGGGASSNSSGGSSSNSGAASQRSYSSVGSNSTSRPKFHCDFHKDIFTHDTAHCRVLAAVRRNRGPGGGGGNPRGSRSGGSSGSSGTGASSSTSGLRINGK